MNPKGARCLRMSSGKVLRQGIQAGQGPQIGLGRIGSPRFFRVLDRADQGLLTGQSLPGQSRVPIQD